MFDSSLFIELTLSSAIQVVFLGFVGGVLSGFIGTGGAFFMTPGLMNLGVPGVVAVGSNITHKFGKALVGAKSHSELGHVDKKLGYYMLISAVVGVRLAVMVNEMLFHSGTDSESGSSAAGDLYISAIFVIVLLNVAFAFLYDLFRGRKGSSGPSTRIAETFSKIKIPPMIYFPVADVRLSFWVVSLVGFLTGYLAGTTGAGGFLGVPAMIYIFGIPTAVAAGTELFLAMFMGAWGAINYAWSGFVDIRLTMLLFIGSLSGIYIGVYGTKVVKEKLIRLVTALIILLCVFSRGINIPVYLDQLGWMELAPGTDQTLNLLSKLLLFASGITGVVVILIAVFKAYTKRRDIQTMLEKLD